MIKTYLYRLKLLDPLFYAREGLSASFTPLYLHGTAINHAVKFAMNMDPHGQPLLISGNSRNIPQYSSSLISDEFYFTAGRLITPLKYFPEITKGENDGYVFKTGMGELFQAGILNYIPPEAIFEGYLIERKNHNWPYIIRLGSFRGKARLEFIEIEIINALEQEVSVRHPVDPLVTSVKRGVAINLFPYPLIENARTSHGVICKEDTGSIHIIAFPDKWKLPLIEKLKYGKSPLIV